MTCGACCAANKARLTTDVQVKHLDVQHDVEVLARQY